MLPWQHVMKTGEIAGVWCVVHHALSVSCLSVRLLMMYDISSSMYFTRYVWKPVSNTHSIWTERNRQTRSQTSFRLTYLKLLTSYNISEWHDFVWCFRNYLWMESSSVLPTFAHIYIFTRQLVMIMQKPK